MTEPLIAGIDTETTGLNTPDHRFVEVYIGLWKGEKKVWQYETRIDPERAIPADATAVHHITNACVLGKPKWEQVAPRLVQAMNKADHWVIHNAAFDMEFIDRELTRIGLRHTLEDRPVTDTMTEGVWATADGKKPTLKELCFACGVAYDESLAHAAAYDVDRMVQCYFQGIKFGFYPAVILPHSAQAA